MSINKYDSTTGTLTTLASGDRTWIGTRAQYDAQKTAGTLPNNCLIVITDDEQDSRADQISYDNTDSGLTADNVQDAIDEINNDLLKQQSGKSELLTMSTDYTSFKITMPRAFADANYRVFLTAEDANGMFDALWVHPTSERTSSTFKVIVYCPHNFSTHNLYINWLAIHD